jgi:hypothetical protein
MKDRFDIVFSMLLYIILHVNACNVSNNVCSSMMLIVNIMD